MFFFSLVWCSGKESTPPYGTFCVCVWVSSAGETSIGQVIGLDVESRQLRIWVFEAARTSESLLVDCICGLVNTFRVPRQTNHAAGDEPVLNHPRCWFSPEAKHTKPKRCLFEDTSQLGGLSRKFKVSHKCTCRIVHRLLVEVCMFFVSLYDDFLWKVSRASHKQLQSVSSWPRLAAVSQLLAASGGIQRIPGEPWAVASMQSKKESSYKNKTGDRCALVHGCLGEHLT